MAKLIRAGRVEAEPDGDVFLAQHIDREQNPAEILAQIRCPLLADILQLPRQRIRRSQDRGT